MYKTLTMIERSELLSRHKKERDGRIKERIKSVLLYGNALSQSRQLPLFHMDGIRWDQRGYEIRRSTIDIERDLEVHNLLNSFIYH